MNDEDNGLSLVIILSVIVVCVLIIFGIYYLSKPFTSHKESILVHQGDSVQAARWYTIGDQSYFDLRNKFNITYDC